MRRFEITSVLVTTAVAIAAAAGLAACGPPPPPPGPPGSAPFPASRVITCAAGESCEAGKACRVVDGISMCVYTCPATGGAPERVCDNDELALTTGASCACVARNPQGRACTDDRQCVHAPDATPAQLAVVAYCAQPPGAPRTCLAKGIACTSGADCGTGRCDPATRMCAAACDAREGQACGCSGTIRCDGSCSSPAPPNLGQRCGCGGTIGCDGGCSAPGPGNLGQACGCGGTIGCDGRCSRECAPKQISVELTEVDDDGYVWLGPASGTGSALLAVNTGHVPRAGLVDITRALRQRGLTSARLTVKIGNGGGFGSKGTVRVLVDGHERAVSREHDTAWKHTGWTHCVKYDVDIASGDVTEKCAASCANHLDCDRDCGSQCPD